MHRDLRQSALFEEAEALLQSLLQPGSGQITDASELHASPDGRHALFTGSFYEQLAGAPTSRVCQLDLATGDIQVLTFGPNGDRLPKYSPDGARIAFLSDRHEAGDFQLYFLDGVGGAAHATAAVDGWVEYFHWSPDGRQILLAAAGHGADVSGGQGAVASQRKDVAADSWKPSVDTGAERFRWRTLWLYDVETRTVRQLTTTGINIWEAAWCGPHAVLAVASDSPTEGAWYTATLRSIDIESGSVRTIHTPRDQLGWPCASPSGKHAVIVEAVCSDRWVVAGDVLLVDPACGRVERLATHDVDITYAEWRSESRLLLGGHRGFESVLLEYDACAGEVTECWADRRVSPSGRYLKASPLGEDVGGCVFVAEGFLRAPEIGRVRNGVYETLRSFDVGGLAHARASIGAVDEITWQAPDGLEIQGWLVAPLAGRAPHPLVVCIHGGPVWHWRPRWLARATSLPELMLLRHGYALFYPNPRGSSARGQDYARAVQGDLGGAETYDHLSGIDHLIAKGIADSRRLGVTGGSHGGFMSSWLITKDDRFAAAVPVASVTDRVSQYLTCAHSNYVALFLNDTFDNPGGRFFERSPIMRARHARTPTLHITGALDRSTPPGQAVEFHNALLEHGVESVLVIYPEEGHGIRKLPAALDYAARLVGWFDTHLREPAPADR